MLLSQIKYNFGFQRNFFYYFCLYFLDYCLTVTFFKIDVIHPNRLVNNFDRIVMKLKKNSCHKNNNTKDKTPCVSKILRQRSNYFDYITPRNSNEILTLTLPTSNLFHSKLQKKTSKAIRPNSIRSCLLFFQESMQRRTVMDFPSLFQALQVG